MEQAEPRRWAARLPWQWVLVIVFGIILLVWLANTPPGILGKADAVGYAVCHQIDLRSFHMGTRQLPLCARCSGMYLGAVAGLIFQLVVGRKRTSMPPWRVLLVLGLFVIGFGVDGVNSYLHLFPGLPGLYEPQNWLRLITGTGMGIVIAAGLFPAFNQTVWADWDQRPAIGSIKTLATLVLVALIVDVLVLTENPVILYPLALVSASGVLILLSLVYLIMLLMIFKRDNLATDYRQLAFPAVGGLLLALVQVGLLDLVRFWLTGTWNGFQFG